jgi:hypothetical protein
MFCIKSCQVSHPAANSIFFTPRYEADFSDGFISCFVLNYFHDIIRWYPIGEILNNNLYPFKKSVHPPNASIS